MSFLEFLDKNIGQITETIFMIIPVIAIGFFFSLIASQPENSVDKKEIKQLKEEYSCDFVKDSDK